MNKCCKTCHRVNTKSNAEMAKQGFALCNLGPGFEFHARTYVCNDWKKAEEKPVAWLEKAV